MNKELTYEKQNKFFDQELKTRGNWMVACYANYLGISIDQCPPFEEFFEVKKPMGFWWDCVILWWENLGFKYHCYPYDEKYLNEIGDDYYFVSGKSIRGIHHLVIYKNGMMIFDPHPSNSGLETLERIEFVKKISN